MKKFLLLFFLLSFSFAKESYSQLKGREIPLQLTGREKKPEFSGLAIYKDSLLLLLPQYKNGIINDTGFFLYTLPLRKISEYLRDPTIPIGSFGHLTFRNLKEIYNSHPGWDGMEAVAVVGTDLYFSIETSQGGCIVKGSIVGEDIVMDTNYSASLPTVTEGCKNAGYESLGYAPGLGKLLSVFEYNEEQPQAYWTTPGVQDSLTSLEFPRNFFRITDVAVQGNMLYAVNFFWGGEYDCATRKGAMDSIIKAQVPSLQGKNLNDRKFSFARILKMDLANRPLKWEVLLDSIDIYRANWEGIVKFQNGFLLVSDANINDPLDTKLTFFEISEN